MRLCRSWKISTKAGQTSQIRDLVKTLIETYGIGRHMIALTSHSMLGTGTYALQAEGADSRITEIANADHFAVPGIAYKDEKLISWLVSGGTEDTVQ